MEYLKQIEYSEVELDDEIATLAEEYVKAGLIPRKYEEDALHIALATIFNCNAIVSWNFTHMVKLKTMLGVNGINKSLGYGEIEIVSPMNIVSD